MGELVDRVVRKNTNNESTLPLTISAQYGLVDQITYFNNRVASRDVSNYYLVLNGEFAYNKSTSDGYPFGAVKRLDLYEKGVLSTLYIVFAPKKEQQIDSDYLTVFFDTDRWHKGVAERAAEGARNHGLLNISAEDFFDIDLSVPKDIVEQKQIGAFIRQLDNLITLHQRKFEKLTNVKKSMLEKMFPQNGSSYPEIRFKGFTDPWEQRKFDEVFDCTVPNNTLSRAELSYDEGTVLNVHYGDVLIKYGSVLDVQKDDIPRIPHRCREDFNGALLQDGDVIIADTAEDETTGKACEIGNLQGSAIVSGLHTMVCRPRNRMALGYLGYYLNSNAYHYQLLPLMQGIKVLSLSRSNIQKTSVSYPIAVKEQQLIAYYFRQLDNLITLHQRQPFLHSTPDISLIVQLTLSFYTFSWEQRKLGDIGKARSGVGFPDADQGGLTGVPFFKVSDMNSDGNENEMTVANNYVTAEQIADHRWSPITELPAIFFAKVGAAVMLNRKRLCRFPFLLDNNTMAYSLSPTKWDADFAKALFGTVDLTSLVQVGALPSYNAGDVESMEIYLPSLLEQEQIGAYFNHLDNLITLHQRQPIVYAVIHSIRKANLVERQYFAPPMVRKFLCSLSANNLQYYSKGINAIVMQALGKTGVLWRRTAP